MAPVSLDAIVAEIKAHSERHYVYILHRPCGTPFYVGVGTGRRIRHHEKAASSAQQSAKYEVIRAIVADGENVTYSIAAWFEDWADAAREERRLIAAYGRADRGDGPLANRTNGGQGLSGHQWVMTPNRAAGISVASEKNRGRKHSPEHRMKISAAMTGHVWKPETLERRSASLKDRPLSASTRQKLSEVKAGRPMGDACNIARDEYLRTNREKVSAKFKANWADPEIRARMLAARSRKTQ